MLCIKGDGHCRRKPSMSVATCTQSAYPYGLSAIRLELRAGATFAGALTQIIQTQPDPRPLCTVVMKSVQQEAARPVTHPHPGLETAAAVTSADDGPRAGETPAKKRRLVAATQAGMRSGADDESGLNAASGPARPREGNAQHLPAQAWPLQSLAEFAAEVLAPPTGSLSAAEVETRPQKKRRRSDSGTACWPKHRGIRGKTCCAPSALQTCRNSSTSRRPCLSPVLHPELIALERSRQSTC